MRLIPSQKQLRRERGDAIKLLLLRLLLSVLLLLLLLVGFCASIFLNQLADYVHIAVVADVWLSFRWLNKTPLFVLHDKGLLFCVAFLLDYTSDEIGMYGVESGVVRCVCVCLSNSFLLPRFCESNSRNRWATRARIDRKE